MNRSSYDQTMKRHYWVWASMIGRCGNPKNNVYLYYGGRGIQVCDRWRSFDLFIADMGLRPAPRSTLERIDNSLGYNKENCRWAPYAEQAKNKRAYRNNQAHCGVTTIKGGWRARIGVDGHSYHLGCFSSLDAALAARANAMRVHGFNPSHGM